MKPLAILFAVSIAANAALAVFLLRSNNAASTGTGSYSGEKVQVLDGSAFATTAAGQSVATAGGKGGTAGLAFIGLDPKKIGSLTSAELKVLIEKLRAAGFPASFIRAIAAAEVRERHSSELKALLDNQPDDPFWQRTNSIDPKLMASLRSLNRKQSDELKDLLGTEAVANDENAYWRRRQFGNLSPEKLAQVQDVIRDYSELRSEIQANTNGVYLPEDREKLALLDKEQRTDLSSVLSAEELENYELRSSTSASMLRSQLSTFKPSEQEFRALFAALRSAESQYGSLGTGGTTGDQMTKIREAVLAGVQSGMSPERLAELKQATDPRYQMTNRLVSRLGLPASTSVDVANVQQSVMQQVSALRRDTTLDPAARSTQLTAISQETATKLSTLLTPRGYEAYKQYGGYWLQNINPPQQQRRPSATP